MSGGSTGGWNCSVCTFANPSAAVVRCGMCDTPRAGVVFQSQPLPPQQPPPSAYPAAAYAAMPLYQPQRIVYLQPQQAVQYAQPAPAPTPQFVRVPSEGTTAVATPQTPKQSGTIAAVPVSTSAGTATTTGTASPPPTAAGATRTCARCTYVNPASAAACDMCQSPLQAIPAPIASASGSGGSAADAKSKPPAAASGSGKNGESFVLSEQQREEFYRNGYLILKNVVPAETVASALRAINQNLGSPSTNPVDHIKAKAGIWFPELSKTPAITDLFNRSPARTCASQLIGAPVPFTCMSPPGAHAAPPYRLTSCPFALPIGAGQIALRMPGALCVDKKGLVPIPWWSRAFHIDGFHSKDNGIPKGSIRNFTCLVGVVLSSVPHEFCGNFTVYPRSHRVMEKYFRENGFDAVKDGLESLPRLPLAKPVQVTAEPGDVVLAHYLLCHSIAPNTSPHIRYAIYFRVSMHANDVHHAQSMKEMWSEWPAMKSLIERDAKSSQKEGETGGTGEGGDLLRPIYADELFRAQDKLHAAEDAERAKELAVAEAKFTAHDWSGAAAAYARLATNESYRDEFEVQLRAGCAHTWTPNDSDAITGEAFLRRAIELQPTLPNVYSALAMNLARQTNHFFDKNKSQTAAGGTAAVATRDRSSEVIDAVWRMLRCPPPVDLGTDPNPKHNFVVDGLKQASAALARSGGDASVELRALVDEATRVYPIYTKAIAGVMEGSNGDRLWVAGKQWLDSPIKDFKRGEAIFTALVAARPTDYWAVLLLGGCISWSGRPAVGEPHVRAALKMDPSIPNAYAVLAQCLAAQSGWFGGGSGKAAEAAKVVEDMIGREFKAVHNNSDGRKQIIDALTVAEKVYGRSSQPFKALVARAITAYPAVAPAIKQQFS